jgi:hypothetical protein
LEHDLEFFGWGDGINLGAMTHGIGYQSTQEGTDGLPGLEAMILTAFVKDGRGNLKKGTRCHGHQRVQDLSTAFSGLAHGLAQ